MANPKICSKPAAALAVSLFALASTGSATVQCNSAAPMPYVVPATFAGVYVNLVTGIFSITTSGAPGWDIGPWGTSSLLFFFPSSPANTSGGSSTAGVYDVLNAGAPIGPANTYIVSTSGTAAALWQVANTGKYFGLRFWNESTSAINYGWIQLDTSATTLGHPATIRGYCYQDDGTAIDAGSTTPVELQSFSVE